MAFFLGSWREGHSVDCRSGAQTLPLLLLRELRRCERGQTAGDNRGGAEGRTFSWKRGLCWMFGGVTCHIDKVPVAVSSVTGEEG